MIQLHIHWFTGRVNVSSSSRLRIVFWGIALLMALMGLMFIIAAGQSNAVIRIAIGIVCLAAAGALVFLARMQPVQQTHVHKMELDISGDVSLEDAKCKFCGATLGTDSVNMAAGAVFINCEYCGASYQIEEAPKW